MIERVRIREAVSLEDYSSVLHLTESVRTLRAQAEMLVPRLEGRKIWMVNSTAHGGGVAEMLPELVSILNELGVDTEWIVMGASQPKFFMLTKRLHNLIHGHGDPQLTAEDRALYEAVSRENAAALEEFLGPQDILVTHDPQPLGMGALIKRELGIPAIFRCHIGLDQHLPTTRAAWSFLRPFAEAYDFSVFTAPEYIPGYLTGRAGVICPAIDPLSDKNRELTPHVMAGILCNGRLISSSHPVAMPPFPECAKRLLPDGIFSPADQSNGIGLLFRPTVTQVSRWDRLKGFKPLLEGFVRLKGFLSSGGPPLSEVHRRRLEIVRLVLAGPDPAAIQDDPEGQEVLMELIETYRGLDPALQEDIAIVSLPMSSRKHNAVMVNVLQRASTVIVQNSLREGFGLTVTEAMWKRAAVLGTWACGIRQQIRDGTDGRLIHDPEDPDEIASLLNHVLEDYRGRAYWAQNAQRRVHSEFLVFNQVARWLRVLTERVNP